MGAAGLTSSSFEMAARGGAGIELDLDAVPLRETGMTAYEIMLSESQERMLMVLQDGREAEARAVFDKWGLDLATVGRVTATGRMVIRHGGAVVADLPIAPVAGAAPVYDRPSEPTPTRVPITGTCGTPSCAHRDALLRLIGSPDLCSKRWIFEQYDHMVMADTVQPPGGDAAVVRIHGSNRGLALTTDCTPRYCEADPVEGGRQAVAEAWRNLVAVGARPLAITNCLNFGNPERPVVMGQLKGCLEGMADACRALDFPIVSGNVSLYNETDGRAIQPTPSIGGVGLLDDLGRMCRIGWDAPGLVLLLVGECVGWFGASLYLREIQGREDGAPPPVDLAAERRHGELVARAIASGRVRACHDLSDGGLAVALAEMCLAAEMGAELMVPADVISRVGWLFGEEQGRYLLAVAEGAAAELLAEAAAAGVLVRAVGRTGGDALTLEGEGAISLAELRRAHEGWLPGYMAGGSA
jgi:phosphoribosylformylglycinamidine synthase